MVENSATLYSWNFWIEKYDLVFWLLRYVKESAWRVCYLEIKISYLGLYER